MLTVSKLMATSVSTVPDGPIKMESHLDTEAKTDVALNKKKQKNKGK